MPQVFGAGVTDGNGGVGTFAFLGEDVGQGSAHEGAAANDDDVFAIGVEVAAFENVLYAVWGAG